MLLALCFLVVIKSPVAGHSSGEFYTVDLGSDSEQLGSLRDANEGLPDTCRSGTVYKQTCIQYTVCMVNDRFNE